MIWNLSCKGYNYWSNNWIYIIKNLETKVIGGHEELGIYNMFSETVIENESKSGYLNKPANISTPKLTLVASFFSMLIWAIFASIEFFKMYHITICMKVACISIGVFVLFILYVLLLNSSFLESRPTSFSSDRIERFRRN